MEQITPKRSDTDPMVAFFERTSNSSKVPKPARLIAGLLGRHRRWMSDTSERAIGAASPLKARLDSMAARTTERSAKWEQKFADQERRMGERFGPIDSGTPAAMPVEYTGETPPDAVQYLPPVPPKKDTRQ